MARPLRIVADSIHLNPARAGLAVGSRGKLTAYPLSSLPANLHERGPKWLVCQRVLGLANDGDWPGNARKGDPHKTALATLIKTRTCVSNEWLAGCLKMGHNRPVSRLIRQGKDQHEVQQLCRQLAKMLPCED